MSNELEELQHEQRLFLVACAFNRMANSVKKHDRLNRIQYEFESVRRSVEPLNKK
jgi:hypothetical protein